jgi:hypothetical protein
MKTWMVGMMAALWMTVAVGAAKPVYTAWLSNTAVGGYDAVSFFGAAGPVKGIRDHVVEYQGAVWQFASADNMALFKADPARYAPQYGGYCAWAASRNELAPGDPAYWTLIEGKLYLNYSRKVQADWEKDIAGFIQKADRYWPELSK